MGAAVGLPETLAPARRSSGGLLGTLRTFRALSSDSRFIGYALSGGLAFGAMFAYISGSPFVLQGIYHVSPQTFSVIFGANAFGFVVASQVNGSLVGRIPLARLLVAGLITSAASGITLLLLVLIGGHGLVAILPPLFFLVSSIGFIVPNATALALSIRPDAAGTGSALLGVVQLSVGAAGAPLVGVAGISSALPMAGVIALSASGAILAFVVTSAVAGRRELPPIVSQPS